jgi:hypothetical protein
MTRLPLVGVRLSSTPEGTFENIERVLSDLKAREHYSESDIQLLHASLARVVGMWSAEQERIQVTTITSNLRSLGGNLLKAAAILQSHDTGIQRRDRLETLLQLEEYLALEPTVGTVEKARDLLASFAREAAKIGHASMIAGAGLAAQPGERGRPGHDWYDLFTSILFDVAARAKVKPALGRNGSTGDWTGWLLRAARSFETLLPAHMRSQSIEACAKRLNRSKRRVRQRHGQK